MAEDYTTVSSVVTGKLLAEDISMDNLVIN